MLGFWDPDRAAGTCRSIGPANMKSSTVSAPRTDARWQLRVNMFPSLHVCRSVLGGPQLGITNAQLAVNGPSTPRMAVWFAPYLARLCRGTVPWLEVLGGFEWSTASSVPSRSFRTTDRFRSGRGISEH